MKAKKFLLISILFFLSILPVFALGYHPSIKADLGTDSIYLNSDNSHSGVTGFVTSFELNPIRLSFPLTDDLSVYLSSPLLFTYNGRSYISARTFIDERDGYQLGLKSEFCFKKLFDNPFVAFTALFYGVEYYKVQGSGSAILNFDIGLGYHLTKRMYLGCESGFRKSKNKLEIPFEIFANISVF